MYGKRKVAQLKGQQFLSLDNQSITQHVGIFLKIFIYLILTSKFLKVDSSRIIAVNYRPIFDKKNGDAILFRFMLWAK